MHARVLPPSPRGSCCAVIGGLLFFFSSVLSAWSVGVRRRWLLRPPSPPLVCVVWVLLLCPFDFAPAAWSCPSVCRLIAPGAAPLRPPASCLPLFCRCRRPCGLVLCCTARCVLRSRAVLCRVFYVLVVWCGAALRCFEPPCGVLRCCVAPQPVALRCALCYAVLRCFLLCLSARCLVAWRRAVGVLSCCAVLVCFSVCCAVSLGAVLRPFSSCCSVPCSAVANCVVCVVLCCFFACFVVLLCAVLSPGVLCAALRAVPCCAVPLCVVLCFGLWCLGALCCAVPVVSCCFVWVCVSV